MQSKMIFEQAKQANLVALLAQLGFVQDRIKGNDYWYRSPFRQEHTASFKVNRQRNIWYDHGEGIGGNIIDFVARFFRCNANEAAKKVLELNGGAIFSFHQQYPVPTQAGEKKKPDPGKILITDARPLQDKSLLAYLDKRKIPLAIAEQYCKEVDFLLYQKQHTVIGFENRSGGFELRSATFKGSSAPKDVSFFDNGKQDVCVFEGFFDFLSFAVIRHNTGAHLPNCLTLNSLSFFEKSCSLMEQHGKVFLFLDRGNSGREKTKQALDWDKAIKADKYRDCSNFYRRHEDINDWLVAQSRQQQQSIKQRERRL